MPAEKIHFVGNVMIDTLVKHRPRAARSPVLDELGVEFGEYALATLHRPANYWRLWPAVKGRSKITPSGGKGWLIIYGCPTLCRRSMIFPKTGFGC